MREIIDVIISPQMLTLYEAMGGLSLICLAIIYFATREPAGWDL